jgi:hypothetical protein
MDPQTFDELTKALASTTSRRTALKTIFASVVGGAFGLSSLDAALAKSDYCYGNGHKCHYNKDCCSHYCYHGYCRHKCYDYGHKCQYNYDCCSNYCYNGYCKHH